MGVADGGLLVEPEDGGQVERVGAAGEGLVELAVDAQPFQRGVEPAEGLRHPGSADWAGLHGALLAEDQVRVGGVGPASAPVGEPGEQDLAGEVIEWADTAGDDQLPVAEVDVTELELPDGLGAGGVHRGQGEGQAGGGRRRCGGRCGGGLADLLGSQWKEQAVGLAADSDPGGRVAEDGPGLLAVAKQRPEDAEGVVAFAAVQRLADRHDVVAGDLAEMVVACRPVHQHRADLVEVGPHGRQAARTAPRAAVSQRAQPVLGVTPDPGGEVDELALQPGLEGWDAVIVEQAEVVEDLDGALDAEPVAAQDRKQLREADRVAVGVARQQDDQRPVDVASHRRGPAASLTDAAGELSSTHECRVVEVGVLASAEARVVTTGVDGEAKLSPASGRFVEVDQGGPGTASTAARLAEQGPRLADTVHAGEEQLLTGEPSQERLQHRDLAFGLKAGLQPAQPAVALLDRNVSSARCACADLVELTEGVAGSAVPSREHTPGEAADAARRRLVRRDPAHQTGGSDRPSRRLGVTGGPADDLADEDAAACWSRSPCSPAGRATLSGSGIRSSSTPQPSTAQSTSRSSSLMLAGRPDHSPDILPALITRPWSASMRCSSLAFQMPRLAAARRRFHLMA